MPTILSYIEELVISRLLTKRNVALVDPNCGCLRSPDVRLSEPCPDSSHSRSTERAFAALNREEAAINV